jgi:GH25 family lysozyme M1 (1,4-beta-N-acetylmuramidase)
MQSRSDSNIKGIDVSNHQGAIDFRAVKDSGIEIVYMKATEGATYKDPWLHTNYGGAKVNGLKVGFYHFFRAKDEAHAKAQAKFFAECIAGLEADCRHALDIETAEGKDPATLSYLAKVFLEEVKNLTGKEVVLYTYTHFAQNSLDSSLSGYPLWIAQYGAYAPANSDIWNDWIGFQYTNSGSVAGVNGRVDMNEFTPEIYIKSAYDVPVDFDEATYLELNPDVADAIKQGLYGLKSGAQHYATAGKSEGRAYKIEKPKRYYVRTEKFFGPTFQIINVVNSCPVRDRLYANIPAANTIYFETQYLTIEQCVDTVEGLAQIGIIAELVEE